MNRKVLAAYQQGGIEASVSGASPHQLIQLLFDGALSAIRLAQREMAAGHIAQKGDAISKAAAILQEGLRGGLNLAGGGELAQNLDSLYDYCSMQLMQAHQENDAAKLEQVLALLTPLRDAWYEIGKPGYVAAPAMAAV